MSKSPQIFVGLYREGTTDRRFFKSVIQRTFQAVSFECKKEVNIMDVVDIEVTKAPSFVDDVVAASHKGTHDFGISVLCIHTDADKQTDTYAFNNKINPALRRIETEPDEICKIIVPIVPVRMTEAWMLADKDLLKSRIGTKKSDRELGFDKQPEQIMDPKKVINDAIRTAYQERSRRHRNDSDISALYHQIGESVSLDVLRQLPSFRKFEDHVRNAFRELKYLN
jgi:hypothetical protein